MTPAPGASVNPTQIWAFVLARVWGIGVAIMLLCRDIEAACDEKVIRGIYHSGSEAVCGTQIRYVVTGNITEISRWTT